MTNDNGWDVMGTLKNSQRRYVHCKLPSYRISRRILLPTLDRFGKDIESLQVYFGEERINHMDFLASTPNLTSLDLITTITDTRPKKREFPLLPKLRKLTFHDRTRSSTDSKHGPQSRQPLVGNLFRMAPNIDDLDFLSHRDFKDAGNFHSLFDCYKNQLKSLKIYISPVKQTFLHGK
jgi:hypothetical protein